MRFSIWILVAVLISIHVKAATFCVAAGDVAGLSAALIAEENNGEDDTIQLQSGQYDLFTRLEHYSSEPHNLVIEGGYQDFFGNPCGIAPQTNDARPTVINGNAVASIKFSPSGGSLTVRNLTIENAAESGQIDSAIEMFSGFNTTIENSIFQGNLAYNASAVSIYADHGIQIQNSLFVSNISLYSGGGSVAAIQIRNNALNCTISNIIVNSTFSANSAQQLGGVLLWDENPGCITLVANSILWGNGGPWDLSWNNSSTTYLANDDIGDYAVPPASVSAVLSVDPLFKDQANSDYSLKDASSLHDKGSTGGIFWGPGQWDVIGDPRTDGANPDIGAYEIYDVIFANDFDQ